MRKHIQEMYGVGFVLLCFVCLFSMGLVALVMESISLHGVLIASVNCTGKKKCLWGQMFKDKLTFCGVHTWVTEGWKFGTVPSKTASPKLLCAAEEDPDSASRFPTPFQQNLEERAEKKLQILVHFELVDSAWGEFPVSHCKSPSKELSEPPAPHKPHFIKWTALQAI